MKKLIITIMLTLMYSAMGFAASNASEVQHKSHLIGGFSAPIFLKHYDQSTLEDILGNRNVTKITISYPHQLKALSDKVTDYLVRNSENRFKVIATESNPVDTNSVKYRHDAIVIVLWFSKRTD